MTTTVQVNYSHLKKKHFRKRRLAHCRYQKLSKQTKKHLVKKNEKYFVDSSRNVKFNNEIKYRVIKEAASKITEQLITT